MKNRLVGEGRELPIFVVFGENKTDPAVIDLDLRDYRYCTFISILNEYAGYSNKLPGVLPQFAPLVKTFVAGDRTVRSQVFKEAKELYDSISDKRIIGDADYYIKVRILILFVKNFNLMHR